MRRVILCAVALCAVLLSGVSPAHAETKLEKRYSALYHAVKDKHGKRTPGRNIRRHGVKTKRGTRDASNAELARSIRTFRRWLAPPVPAAAPGDIAPVASSASATSTGGKFAIPSYIVMRESGGDYGAYNANGCVTKTSRGCIGAYQIASFHYAAGGACAGFGQHPAGQDKCAAKLWDQSGSAPWAATR